VRGWAKTVLFAFYLRPVPVDLVETLPALRNWLQSDRCVSHCVSVTVSLSLPLTLSPTVSPTSLSLTVSLSLCLPLCLCHCVSPTVSPTVCLSLCVSHYLSHCVSLTVSLTVSLSLRVTHCLSHCVSLDSFPAIDGFFPFEWLDGYRASFDGVAGRLLVPPILENFVLNRGPTQVLAWADQVCVGRFTRENSASPPRKQTQG
jgi:hypothetical protein